MATAYYYNRRNAWGMRKIVATYSRLHNFFLGVKI